LRLVRRLEVIAESSALILHLRSFEPVHVIIDIAHSRGEFLANSVQMRYTLCYSAPLPTYEQRCNLLILARDRTQDWMCRPNKQQQALAHVVDCGFSLCGQFAARKLAKIAGFGRPRLREPSEILICINSSRRC